MHREVCIFDEQDVENMIFLSNIERVETSVEQKYISVRDGGHLPLAYMLLEKRLERKGRA